MTDKLRRTQRPSYAAMAAGVPPTTGESQGEEFFRQATVRGGLTAQKGKRGGRGTSRGRGSAIQPTETSTFNPSTPLENRLQRIGDTVDSVIRPGGPMEVTETTRVNELSSTVNAVGNSMQVCERNEDCEELEMNGNNNDGQFRQPFPVNQTPFRGGRGNTRAGILRGSRGRGSLQRNTLDNPAYSQCFPVRSLSEQRGNRCPPAFELSRYGRDSRLPTSSEPNADTYRNTVTNSASRVLEYPSERAESALNTQEIPPLTYDTPPFLPSSQPLYGQIQGVYVPPPQEGTRQEQSTVHFRAATPTREEQEEDDVRLREGPTLTAKIRRMSAHPILPMDSRPPSPSLGFRFQRTEQPSVPVPPRGDEVLQRIQRTSTVQLENFRDMPLNAYLFSQDRSVATDSKATIVTDLGPMSVAQYLRLTRGSSGQLNVPENGNRNFEDFEHGSYPSQQPPSNFHSENWGGSSTLRTTRSELNLAPTNATCEQRISQGNFHAENWGGSSRNIDYVRLNSITAPEWVPRESRHVQQVANRPWVEMVEEDRNCGQGNEMACNEGYPRYTRTYYNTNLPAPLRTSSNTAAENVTAPAVTNFRQNEMNRPEVPATNCLNSEIRNAPPRGPPREPSEQTQDDDFPSLMGESEHSGRRRDRDNDGMTDAQITHLLPKHFDEKGEKDRAKLGDWLDMFEHLASKINLSEQKRLTRLTLLVPPDVFRVIKNEGANATYRQVLRRLHQRFVTDKTKEEWQDIYHSIKQNPGEDLKSYGGRFEDAYQRGYVGSSMDIPDVISKFIRGIAIKANGYRLSMDHASHPFASFYECLDEADKVDQVSRTIYPSRAERAHTDDHSTTREKEKGVGKEKDSSKRNTTPHSDSTEPYTERRPSFRRSAASPTRPYQRYYPQPKEVATEFINQLRVMNRRNSETSEETEKTGEEDCFFNDSGDPPQQLPLPPAKLRSKPPQAVTTTTKTSLTAEMTANAAQDVQAMMRQMSLKVDELLKSSKPNFPVDGNRNVNNDRKRGCFLCNKEDHFFRDCPSATAEQKKKFEQMLRGRSRSNSPAPHSNQVKGNGATL